MLSRSRRRKRGAESSGSHNPEEAIEASELWSLRSAAEQGKLLPERQVLEREVGAGFERRAQRAQHSEYERHCSPCLARRSPIVQSRDRVLANDTARVVGDTRIR